MGCVHGQVQDVTSGDFIDDLSDMDWYDVGEELESNLDFEGYLDEIAEVGDNMLAQEDWSSLMENK